MIYFRLLAFTELQNCGITELRNYGITDLWNYGITELWNYGIAELLNYGITELRNYCQGYYASIRIVCFDQVSAHIEAAART